MVLVNTQLLMLQYATRLLLFILFMIMIYQGLRYIPLRKKKMAISACKKHAKRGRNPLVVI